MLARRQNWLYRDGPRILPVGLKGDCISKSCGEVPPSKIRGCHCSLGKGRSQSGFHTPRSVLKIGRWTAWPLHSVDWAFSAVSVFIGVCVSLMNGHSRCTPARWWDPDCSFQPHWPLYTIFEAPWAILHPHPYHLFKYTSGFGSPNVFSDLADIWRLWIRSREMLGDQGHRTVDYQCCSPLMHPKFLWGPCSNRGHVLRTILLMESINDSQRGSYVVGSWSQVSSSSNAWQSYTFGI